MNLRVTLNGHHFEAEGVDEDSDLTEIAPLFMAWVAGAAPPSDSPAIDALAKRLDEQSDRLSQAVSANQPT